MSGGDQFCMEQLRVSSQKFISEAIETNFAKELMEEADSVREKARLNSVSMKHSGDWLFAAPVRALGLHLRPLEFITSVKCCLGMEVYQTEGPCKSCNNPSDTLGDHAVGCGSDGERIWRHNIIRDAIFMTAKSASLSPAKEENSLLPGSAEKPADVYIPGWSNGCDAAFDVSVVSPLQAQLINKAADEIGSAAIKRFNEKKNKYNTACEEDGMPNLN